MHGIIFIGDYDYVAQNEGELTFKVGDNIRIYQSDGDWWYGELIRTGEIGWVAPSYGHTREESPYAALSKDVKDKKRVALFQSIIQGQTQFISILNSFIESVVAPIANRDTQFKRTMMSEPSVAVSFSLLQEIYNACSNFDSILRRAKTDIEIANAYVQFAPSLQLFAQYASENSVLLNSMKTNIRQLSAFLAGGQNLEGTLILPLEHYPKYKIDFQEFVWLTLPDTPEYNAVAGALDIIIGQTDYVDGKLKEEAESLMLLNLQNQFSGNPVIFTPNRRIIKEAEIERIRLNKEGAIVSKQYYAHLFNDAFVYSSKNVVTGRFKLHNVIDLKGATLGKSDLLETVVSFSLTAKDDGSAKAEHFRFVSDETFRDWYASVGEVIASLKTHKINKRTSVITRSNVSLPGVDPTKLGPRCTLVYRFLLSELQFSEAMSLLNITVIQPLIAASKGAVLAAAKVKSSNIVNGEGDGLQIKEAQSKHQDALFDASASNSASKYQTQVVTDALQDPDVQIFIRAAEGIALALTEFVNALESYCNTASWGEDIVSGTFFNSVSALALYNQFKAYAGGQQATLRILKTQPFAQFYKDAEQYLQSSPGSFVDKVELPRKRVKHFSNFVSDLLKITPESHADHACLTSSLAALNYMEKEIDELIRLKKNFEELLEIQSSLVSLKMIGTEPILQKLASMDRTILMLGDLKKVCRKKNKTFRFWLFNDYIIYGAALGGGKYSFNRALELNKCTVSLHTSTSLKNAFEIFGAEKSFIVIAASQSSQQDWVDKIKKAVTDYSALTGVSNVAAAEQAKSAPLWVPDSSSDGCIVCKQAFTFWNRRHHCRKCGLVVCSEHSKNKEVLLHIHKSQKQRICDNCHLGKTPAHLIAKAEANEKAGVAPGTAATTITTAPAPAAAPTPSTSSAKLSPVTPATATAAASAPVPAASVSVAPATSSAAPALPTKPLKSPKALPPATTTTPAAAPVATPAAAAPAVPTVPPPLPATAPPPLPSSLPPPVPSTAPPPVPNAAPPAVPSISKLTIDTPAAAPEVKPATVSPLPTSAPPIPKSLPVAKPATPAAAAVETPKKGRTAPPPPPVPGAAAAAVPPSSPSPPPAAPAAPAAPPVPRPVSVEASSSAKVVAAAPPAPPAPGASAKVTPSPPAAPVAPPSAQSAAPPPPRPTGPPAPPAPAAPPAPPAAPSATSPHEDDPYRKYRKMLEMLPEGAVIQKMSNDGIPQSEINRFLGKTGGAPAAPPAAAPTGAPRPPPPGGAVAPPPPPAGAPRPPAPPSGAPVPPPAAPPAAASGEPIDEEFKKYIKMKEMLPEGAVRQKMSNDGFAPSDIDAFLSGKVSSISRGGAAVSSVAAAPAAAPMSMAAMLASRPALNKASASPAGPPPPKKMSLMDEIQLGSKLKSVQKEDTRMKATAIQGSGGLLGMLANEMSKRRFNMKVEQEDEDSDSSGFSDSDSEDDD